MPYGKSGYCEIGDMNTHERFRVMKRACAPAKTGAVFRCSDTPGFANFRAEAQQAVERTVAPELTLPNSSNNNNGIVMVVYPSALDPLRKLSSNNTAVEITFRETNHPRAVRFGAKIYVISNSFFEKVLFLDADNEPARDSTFLFDTPESVKTGAIFWPDYWFPQHTIVLMNEQSLVWELLDMPFVDMFEQESGQLLIDRRRHAAPLELVKFYAWHRPDYFNHQRLA
ncbi:hypothetical protein BBJ29_001067 [Phytophthora kernoviae]|uniref:Nucleotide-diphospho-sugar transferase n=1 Tax=Phytophthora kernoviae TaxID=325452 RepID=A0A3F2RZY8_9STRA|nr:hypothetical protein BBJ29_001067 [Phytophthora kernoviae]RLN67528.1 hypothetical protein BBP00_00001557 [Phytophthora kernoviae]